MTRKAAVPGPAYRIKTPRLVIRCPEPSDAPKLDLAIKQSLDHLRPWLLWAKQKPASITDRIEFLRRTRGNFDLGIDFGYLVFDSSEKILIGGTGLHTRIGPEAREIGYWIHIDHTNQGYATEVAAALTKVAFEVEHVRRVEIHCDPENTASAAIPRKLGFTHEATLHHRIDMSQEEFHDSMLWSLFEEGYPLSPSAQADIQAFNVIGGRIL
jgi:RimJ/RimL family protein N-acetyltransferase